MPPVASATFDLLTWVLTGIRTAAVSTFRVPETHGCPAAGGGAVGGGRRVNVKPDANEASGIPHPDAAELRGGEQQRGGAAKPEGGEVVSSGAGAQLPPGGGSSNAVLPSLAGPD